MFKHRDFMQTAVLVTAILVLMMLSNMALASAGSTGAGGTGLPWETPLQQLRGSVTGPVAFTIMLVCLVGIGATLTFGNELNNVLRSGILIVLAGALVMSGAQFISVLFSGAVIPDMLT